MRLWHPQHGIVFTTDQAEIDRLISTGGSEFDVNEKPWIKKEPAAEIVEEIKIQEATYFGKSKSALAKSLYEDFNQKRIINVKTISDFRRYLVEKYSFSKKLASNYTSKIVKGKL